jgi:hypothetical protein
MILTSLQEKNSSGGCRIQTIFLATLVRIISKRQFLKGRYYKKFTFILRKSQIIKKPLRNLGYYSGKRGYW